MDLKNLYAELDRLKQDKNASKANLAKANVAFMEKSAALTKLLSQSHEGLAPNIVQGQSATLTGAVASAKNAMERYNKEVDDNQSKIETVQAEISRRAIQSQSLLAPQGTKVTTTGGSSSRTLLSADQNPYIAQTQLQLLFQQQRFQ